MIKRIITTDGLFLRDDFTANDGEIALDVTPAQGFYLPKWDFATETWTEGATQEYINSLLANQPTPTPSADERLDVLEPTVESIIVVLEASV